MKNSLCLAGVALFLGCGTGLEQGDGGCGNRDLTFVFPENDLAGEEVDLGPGELNPCGDVDPSCQDDGFGPGAGKPFPLPTDMPPDPNQASDGVSRDKNGYLGLDSSHASFDYLYGANTSDWTRGTVSKFDSKTVREVARFFTVTCHSLKTGSKMNCDGQNGCCAMDSNPQYVNRKANMAQGPYQQVNLGTNYPSRTTVDFNGDLWVANRAFGGQSSVTKVANDPTSCVDRNKNGKIDTSRDVNGDGVIQTDCNKNGVADDLADVQGKACNNGLAPEFLGLDDECILITTNTGPPNMLGRPLGLGPGAQDFGPSDPWPGLYSNGQFYRVDGTTGITKDMAQLPQGCQPYGLVVDSSAYGWAGNLGSGLCYFNTKKSSEVGKARIANGQTGYGIALDRDQNIWLALTNAYRYTPNRKNGFMDLGNGFWTTFTNLGQNNGGASAIGIAADSRTNNAFFVWAGGGASIVRIPASTVPLPMGMDTTENGAAYSVAKVGNAKGIGVDREQNVWGIAPGTALVTRVKVDMAGTITQPDIVSPPMGNNLCPAGDRCNYHSDSNESPYTYSDFTGFGLRNFTRPKGFYTYIQKGCVDMNGMSNGETRWVAVKFEADVPLNTSLTLRVRSGNTPIPDLTWGAWTADFSVSPADLINGMPLIPNEKDSSYLQVEFDFATQDKNQSPKLKSFNILHECVGGIG